MISTSLPDLSTGMDDRCDATMERLVHRSLCTTGYPSLGALDCQVTGGSVVLSGRLPSFYMKQLAQEAAFRVPHVRAVTNLIEVVPSRAVPSGRRRDPLPELRYVGAERIA